MKRYLPLVLVMMAARASVAQDANYVGTGPQAAPAPAPVTLGLYPHPPAATRVEAKVETPAPIRAIAPIQTPAPVETPEAKNVEMPNDGRCKLVKPGDVVHYQLTIRSADAARAVYANLQLRREGAGKEEHFDLPFPDALTMGERGVATRDAKAGNVYHVEFTVEKDVPSGLYRGTGVLVTLSADGGVYSNPHYVDVTNHTMREIHHYCLAVAGPYGGEVGGGRPLVTDFKPGLIERK